MNKLISLILMTVSSSALACPDFSGSYVCTSSQGEDHLTYTQTDSSISWTDGKETVGPFSFQEPTPMKISALPALATIQCGETELVLVAAALAPVDGEKTKVTMTLTKASNGFKAKTEYPGGVQNADCTKIQE